jgi:hypothetical protein
MTRSSFFFVALDCFAEPVIGRAFARSVGSRRAPGAIRPLRKAYGRISMHHLDQAAVMR